MTIQKFIIATYNVNSLRSRLHIVIPWLQKTNADVLCLQETKVRDEEFPADAFKDIGYNIVFRGQKAYNGVAVASRHAISNAEFGLGDPQNSPEDEARLIHCIISGIAIINSYVPQGRAVDHPAFQYKLDWYRRLKRLFMERYMGRMPLVWCGDLNIAPEPEDVYDPEGLEDHVCFHIKARTAFKDVKDLGLVDIFRKFNPGPGHYTFYDYRAPNGIKRGIGWRIDHILATNDMAEKATSAFIDMDTRLAEKPSDHAILAAEFSA
ncbi:MAG: exodeoxyribonuclease III [Dissulfurimicrobium sp.]|uniref:exodeoxyribonuclease III n=1 Tax=Dissulfurimicrobium TaxID=1769732 RepID=UPI001EDA48ED|nr:exodeoxyribonuclease III [Dissulfurimicrobium hydrothermale]UKL14152.1 exodeoxyribonuclease III [Dissulfurimicrobium hydrothermale]